MPYYDAELAYLRWLAQEDSAEQLWVRTLREYAGGQQPTYLTTRQQQFVGLKAKDANHLYAHNLCQLVIEAVVDRLVVRGFSPLEDTGAAAADVAMQWWDANRGDALQIETHEAALRDEEAYIIVEWLEGEGRPAWRLNTRYDGTQGVKLHRDAVTGELLYASKRWQEYDPEQPNKPTGRTRLTMYFPNQVERWVSAKPGEGIRVRAGGVESELLWRPYVDASGDPWPIPWVDARGQPLGLAVAPFLNPGGAEIAQVMPAQDMLNKNDLDLIAAADQAGWRILWINGVPKVYDSDGDEISLTVGPGQLLRFDAPDASLNAIEPVDITRLIQGSYYWIESIAGISRTPQHLLRAPGADQPSGQSLLARELGLISKVERKQVVFGNAWEDVLALSFRLAATKGQDYGAPRLSTEWKEARIEDPAVELAQMEIKKRLGVPDEQIFTELGYTPEQIAMFKTMLEEQAQRQTNIGAALLTAFDRGQGTANNGGTQ